MGSGQVGGETSKCYLAAWQNGKVQLTKQVGYSSQFQRNPFAEGSCRYCYRGYMHDRSQNTRVVIKVMKGRYANQINQIADDVKTNVFARIISQKFNQKFTDCDKIYYSPNYVSKVSKMGKNSYFLFFGGDQDKRYKLNEYVSIQKYIYGNYMKFNNNNGYVGQQKYIQAYALSHFSYHISGQKLVLCDLQGVWEKQTVGRDCYFLTDPAFNSTDRQFGNTDLGYVGILRFFITHECNRICSNLKKPRFDKTMKQFLQKTFQIKGLSRISNTSFNFLRKLAMKQQVQQTAKQLLLGKQIKIQHIQRLINA